MAIPEQQKLWGYALVGIGAALFSSKAIFIKLAYEEAPDAAKVLAFRMVVSLPFFAAIGLVAYRDRRRKKLPPPPPRDVAGALIAGLIGYYISMILDFEGLVYITAGLERLVLFTYPVFVILLGSAFFGERLMARSLGAAAITYVGLALVLWQGFSVTGWATAIGTGLVVLCALTFAFYQLIAKTYIARLGSTIFTSVALSGAAVACLLHYAVVSGSLNFYASQRFWLLAAATGLVATVLPNFLVNAGLARIGAQSTAMISTISPVVTIALAVAVLGESFTALDALGTALVIGGIGLHTWFDMNAKPQGA
jgi:drug/metabolite transporter (DMT)-like permease